MRFLRMIFSMTVIFSAASGFSLERSPKVIVVGGGIAGLTTAYRLQNAGMDVELYEARGRVGGRIFTATVNGRTAELGGQNIGDGGKSAHLKRLIDEFELELVASRIYLKHSYFTGQTLIPVKELLKEKEIDPKTLKNQIDELVLTSSSIEEVLEGIFDRGDSLHKVLATRMAAYEGGTIDKLSPIYAETLFHMILGGICSVHQGTTEDKDSYVDLISIKGGNAVLPEKIAERLGPKLHLNKPLIKVMRDKEGLFILTFQNGEKVQADILVLAMPCSVYEQIVFGENVIPSQKLEAIRNIQYGKNAKIMVPFATALPKATGLVGDEVVSFFDSTERLLTVYYTGQNSLFSSETIAGAYAKARPMIERGFGKDCPPFSTPHYAEDQANLSYDGPVGYSWPNDPYARGTYSYIAGGQESILTATEVENGEIFKALFAPIQNLYFAGEHASILSEVPGTMEAACESGERVAHAILQKKK